MDAPRPKIDEDLAARLVAAQFPQWAHLPIRRVVPGGVNNRTFRLGDDLSLRLPRAGRYAPQVEKEQVWLPILAPQLPVAVPEPVAVGEPGEGYSWRWSVIRWIEGESVLAAPPADLCRLAMELAGFLAALHRIEPRGPAAGAHNFFRGGPLATYDAETRRALQALQGKVDTAAAAAIWDAARASAWQGSPVWVHGDVAAGNLLVRDGRLAAVIDWGICGVGDPACDLAIAWTLFEGASRAAFRNALPLDAGTWARACGWALWKALILCAGFSGDHPDVARSWSVIAAVLADPL